MFAQGYGKTCSANFFPLAVSRGVFFRVTTDHPSSSAERLGSLESPFETQKLDFLPSYGHVLCACDSQTQTSRHYAALTRARLSSTFIALALVMSTRLGSSASIIGASSFYCIIHLAHTKAHRAENNDFVCLSIGDIIRL